MECIKAEHAIQRTPNWQCWTNSEQTIALADTNARTHEGPRIRACRAVFSPFTEQSTMIKYTKWQKHFLDFLSINKLITTAFYWVRCCSAVKNFFCVHFGIHGWTLCMHLRAQCNAMQSNPMVKEATRSSFFLLSFGWIHVHCFHNAFIARTIKWSSDRIRFNLCHWTATRDTQNKLQCKKRRSKEFRPTNVEIRSKIEKSPTKAHKIDDCVLIATSSHHITSHRITSYGAVVWYNDEVTLPLFLSLLRSTSLQLNMTWFDVR